MTSLSEQKMDVEMMDTGYASYMYNDVEALGDGE